MNLPFRCSLNKSIKLQFFLAASCILLLLNSCGQSAREKSKALARVNDRYLFPEDLKAFSAGNVLPKDSISLVKGFINGWIKQELILSQAERNLTEQQKDKSKELEDYRKSLVIYEYEKDLILKNLDTVLTDKEILDYYNSNKSNFELKKNLIRINYIKLKRDDSNLDRIRVLLRSESPKDRVRLIELSNKSAVNAFFDDKVWLPFQDVTKEIPIKTYDEEQFLRNNRFLEIADRSFIYLIHIKGFRVKNSISALEYESLNIRNIILNQRKLKLIREMEEKVLRDAELNNNYEIYN